MNRDPRQRWLIAAMLAGAAVLAVLGVLVAQTGAHPVAAKTRVSTPARKTHSTTPGKKKARSSSGVVGSAPSLASQEVPMPAPAAARTAVAACRELLVELNTFNWKTPLLPASDLAVVATPSLAASLANATHMTPGQVGQHVVMAARTAVQVDGKDVIVAVRPGNLPIQVWTCRVSPDSSGNYMVTSLTMGVPGEQGVPRAS